MLLKTNISLEIPSLMLPSINKKTIFFVSKIYLFMMLENCFYQNLFINYCAIDIIAKIP